MLEISSEQRHIDRSINPYQDALTNNSFNNDLRYVENNNNTNGSKQKQHQKTIWFNTPFSKSVKTNIDKVFLQLLSKYFFLDHKIHKTFNRKMIKISYNCIKNINSIISARNRNIFNASV